MKGCDMVFPPETFIVLNLHLMLFTCKIFVDLYSDASKNSSSHSKFNIVNPHQHPLPPHEQCVNQPKTFITRVYANQID